MGEDQKRVLEQQLWNIANEFRDYILGFIFFKYLSEKQYIFVNELLETKNVKDHLQVTSEEDLEAIIIPPLFILHLIS